MANEILVALREDPHLGVGDSAPWVQEPSGANGIFRPSGWLFRASETARICIVLPAVDPTIHATTPGAELLIDWFTTLTDVTNVVKFYVKLYSFAPGNASGTLDPSAANFTAGLDSSVTQQSLGAFEGNRASITIPSAMCVARNKLIGIIERNDSDAADTISGAVYISDVFFEADQA